MPYIPGKNIDSDLKIFQPDLNSFLKPKPKYRKDQKSYDIIKAKALNERRDWFRMPGLAWVDVYWEYPKKWPQRNIGRCLTIQWSICFPNRIHRLLRRQHTVRIDLLFIISLKAHENCTRVPKFIQPCHFQPWKLMFSRLPKAGFGIPCPCQMLYFVHYVVCWHNLLKGC